MGGGTKLGSSRLKTLQKFFFFLGGREGGGGVTTYVYIYIYICVCLYVYIHPSIHPSIHPCMHACMHACMHTYIHTYIHAIGVYIHMITPVCLQFVSGCACMLCACGDGGGVSCRRGPAFFQMSDGALRGHQECCEDLPVSKCDFQGKKTMKVRGGGGHGRGFS